jgi:hypothetical protein
MTSRRGPIWPASPANAAFAKPNHPFKITSAPFLQVDGGLNRLLDALRKFPNAGQGHFMPLRLLRDLG